MLIRIRQETIYRYAASANYSMQILRAQPQDSDTQQVLSWRLSVRPQSRVTTGRDAYENTLQTLYIDHPHGDITLTIEGEVETRDRGGVVSGTSEPFPPAFFLRQTDLTMPDEAIRALAAGAKARSDGAPLDFAHRLMDAVRDAVDYRIGETHAATTAAEALSHGYGVCQDHTHVFCSAARAGGLPARYVSGYLWDDVDTEYEASHAWAEAYIEGLGWVGFDVANRVCPTDAHVRVACGLDYLEAAPVRGLRRGGGDETMEVRLRVDAGAAQQ
ncbi:transglutaminase family protein [Parvibaculum sp.]|jgi:transglutaminase-like putative cysteine protease|uniref:transglutaminase family protein n=1 Tax=Parvibaculum sp. TaxID=2024848 RepID=UPI000C469D95|nr:transglutaminase family protein [Parvibaculum sp.]MAM94833.1 transglutaminase [Parvibaculum sp.]|tara:strand:+ start:4045 stop:4863 length:819 start_codon:yes stop_codon:yes gene_type:complete